MTAGGKGHAQRPTDHEAFAEAFERIFGPVRKITLEEFKELYPSQEQETPESEQDDD